MMIRPAVAHDLPGIQRLVTTCGLFDTLVDYADYTPPVFVAEEQGRIVGFIQALLGRPTSVVMDLAVDPAAQHQGVGRGLLAAIEDTMREQGLTTWVTVVANGRANVQAALEKWGAVRRANSTTFTRRLDVL